MTRESYEQSTHVIAWAKSIVGNRDNVSNDCMCANNGGASGVCDDNYAKMEVELTVTDSNKTLIKHINHNHITCPDLSSVSM